MRALLNKANGKVTEWSELKANMGHLVEIDWDPKRQCIVGSPVAEEPQVAEPPVEEPVKEESSDEEGTSGEDFGLGALDLGDLDGDNS